MNNNQLPEGLKDKIRCEILVVNKERQGTSLESKMRTHRCKFPAAFSILLGYRSEGAPFKKTWGVCKRHFSVIENRDVYKIYKTSSI